MGLGFIHKNVLILGKIRSSHTQTHSTECVCDLFNFKLSMSPRVFNTQQMVPKSLQYKVMQGSDLLLNFSCETIKAYVTLCRLKYFNNQLAKSTSSRARQFTSRNRRNKQVPGLLCISCPDISIPPRSLTKAQVVTAAVFPAVCRVSEITVLNGPQISRERPNLQIPGS